MGTLDWFFEFEKASGFCFLKPDNPLRRQIMKTIVNIILVGAAAILFAACGAPAGNAPANNANTNANAAKPTAAAPTKDALFAMDKQANEAYMKGDAKYFDGFLSDKFVMMDDHGKRIGKADVVKMLGDSKCDIKTWSLDDAQMSMIDADTAVISYKGTFDGTCNGPGGKPMKMPSPIRAASVYVRNGDKWMGAFHGENMIIDPKAPPPPPAKAPDKNEEAKKDDKAAANSSTDVAPAKPVADANTAALVAIHTSGWEAFKAKDAKKLGEITTTDVSTVDPMGRWASSQAAVIKLWTETTKCEGITSVKITDGFASALSPTVEILTTKGTADGSCDGQKNGDLYTAAVYVKEGDAWKLAFMFESLAM